ncbi:hypothetical protein Hhal_0416 [Halorhodospira halophila SL1]|uniref:Uncharacterized protein n=1 Tax=Halorhodospira halophila (strain DSM 244 / SL1) TaxID=349124 RepID=A1WU44_HALHL|nr:hypothetical protein [Halorhodospira halophila]ABM61206.1 hypothetical protein Hhal_0416 [Halorhodospira halophila SL1]
MYVRIVRSGPRRYVRLVEGDRDDNGRVKQCTVANLGRADQLSDDEVDGLIKGLQRAVGRSERRSAEPEFQRARASGDLWALHQPWQELGLDEALRKALRSSRREFDAEALIRAMVFSRLAAPRSKRGVLDWLQEDVSLPGVDVEQLHHGQLLREGAEEPLDDPSTLQGVDERRRELEAREAELALEDVADVWLPWS